MRWLNLGGRLLIVSTPGNFLGLPSVATPVGFDSDGMPISMLFTGSRPGVLHFLITVSRKRTLCWLRCPQSDSIVAFRLFFQIVLYCKHATHAHLLSSGASLDKTVTRRWAASRVAGFNGLARAGCCGSRRRVSSLQ